MNEKPKAPFYTDGMGGRAVRPELLIHHRRAELKSGIGAPSHGKPAVPNPEKARMRQEAAALGMTGKQYQRHLKQTRRTAREDFQAGLPAQGESKEPHNVATAPP